MMNMNYTQALSAAVNELELQFRCLTSREAVVWKLNRFIQKRMRYDPSQLQHDIVNALESANDVTHYGDQYGRRTLCKDLSDRDERVRTAKIYYAFAKRLPCQKEIDEQFRSVLYDLYNEYHSSADYMERLVTRRMNAISPELINPGDSTRLLILKQFLKQLDFFRNTPYFSEKFKNYILKQPNVCTESGNFSPADLTESVFKEFDAHENGEKGTKAEIVMLLKYYGSFLEIDDETRRMLSDALKNPYINLCDITCDQFEKDVSEEHLLALWKTLLACRRKITFTEESISRLPTEYRLSVLVALCGALNLDRKTAAELKSVLPKSHVDQKSGAEGTLSSLIRTDAVKGFDRAAVASLGNRTQALEDLIVKIEARLPEIDIDIPHLTASRKTNQYAKYILSLLLKKETEKIEEFAKQQDEYRKTAEALPNLKATFKKLNEALSAEVEAVDGSSASLNFLLSRLLPMLPEPLSDEETDMIRNKLVKAGCAQTPSGDVILAHVNAKQKINKDGKRLLSLLLEKENAKIEELSEIQSTFRKNTAELKTMKESFKKLNAKLCAEVECINGSSVSLNRLLERLLPMLPEPLSDREIHEIRRELTGNAYAEALDEKINERYKDGLQSIREKPELAILRIADHLAKGFFDNQRSTREYLYIFAIAFDMTFYAGRRNELLDPQTDILKNLFYDYYADNFVNRFRPSKSSQSAENEVDGYGINYKNFAEMSFLYFIAQRGSNASQKLSSAYRMIAECTKNASKQSKKKDCTPPILSLTSDDVRDSAMQKLISLDADAFRKYLEENYDCSNHTKAVRNSAENRTAERLYQQLTERVRKLEHSIFGTEIDQTVSRLDDSDLDIYLRKKYLKKNRCAKCRADRDGNYPACLMDGTCHNTHFFTEYTSKLSKETLGKMRADIREELKNAKENELAFALWSVHRFEWPNGDKAFTALMNYLQKELKETTLSLTKKNRAPERITRTNFIALFYYYVILKSQDCCMEDALDDDAYDFEYGDDVFDDFSDDDDFGNTEFTSFREYYDYCLTKAIRLKDGNRVYTGLDECLAAAGYQQINPKNLFDIFVIFLAFRDYYTKFYHDTVTAANNATGQSNSSEGGN